MSAEASVLIALGVLPAVIALALIAAAGVYAYYGRQQRLRAAREDLRARVTAPAPLPAPPVSALPPPTAPAPHRREAPAWGERLSRLRELAASYLQAWQERREERRPEAGSSETTRPGALASERDEEEAEPSDGSGAAD